MAVKKIPAENKLETNASYEIGKMKILVDRIFREENAETLADIMLRMIKRDIETT